VPTGIPLQLNHHLGLLLFSSGLNSISAEAPGESGPLLRQWQRLAQILLGAVNIEQSKLLNTAHLSTLLGDGLYKDLGKQRQLLGLLATEDVVRSVLQINARQLDLDNSSSPGDFYLDPHTKHYTGEKNVLKGWCSGIDQITSY